jgi:hypothetical protein
LDRKRKSVTLDGGYTLALPNNYEDEGHKSVQNFGAISVISFFFFLIGFKKEKFISRVSQTG